MDASYWLDLVETIGPRFAEGADARDRDDAFVADHYPVLHESGLLSALIPTELGGGGASFTMMAAVLRRLGYYDSSTALALAMHQHLVAFQVFNQKHGRPAPILPRVVHDGVVLVSTGARDWMESNGRVERVEGGFRVSGRKSFASGSPVGAIAVTSAPYDDPDEGPQVLHFAVPLSAEGVSLDNDWQVHGMRATGSGTIVFDQVFVPDTAVSLRRPRDGFAGVFNTVLPVAMPLISGVYVGIAERAVELALPHAKKRASDPTVQWAVGEMVSAMRIAIACHDEAVRLNNDFCFTPGLDLSDRMLTLKSHIVDQSKRAVDAAMEAAGGAGFYRRTGIERLARDVRAGHYHPLPEKQQVAMTGRIALGLDAAA